MTPRLALQMALPYRLAITPTPLSKPDALTLSAQRGVINAGRIEDSATAIQRIREAKSAVDDRLRSWVFHPDEAVVTAILENEEFTSIDREQGGLLMASLYTRAADDAAREGVLWNPLLDQLATTSRNHYGGYQSAQSWGPGSSYNYNSAQTKLATAQGRPGSVEVLAVTGTQIRPVPPDFDTAIGPLVQWAAAQTDPALVRPLARTARSGLVRARIGAAVTCWTVEDITALLNDADPKTVTHVCRNTTALRAHGSAVWDVLVERMLHDLRRGGQHSWDVLGQWEERVELVLKGAAPDPTQMERLTDGILELQRDSRSSQASWPRAHVVSSVVKVLGTHLPVACHHRLTMGLPMGTYDREKLILHPQTSAALLEELLATHSDFATRKLVARASGRVRSQKVRDGLAKSSSPLIAGPLVPGETQPRRFQSLWRKAVSKTEGVQALSESLLDPQDWQAGALLSQDRLVEAVGRVPVRPSEAVLRAAMEREMAAAKGSNYYAQHQLSRIAERRDAYREYAEPRLQLAIGVVRRLQATDASLPPLDPALGAAGDFWAQQLGWAWQNWIVYHAEVPRESYAFKSMGEAEADSRKLQAMIKMIEKHPDVLVRFVDRPFLKQAMLSPHREVRTAAMGLLTRLSEPVTAADHAEMDQASRAPSPSEDEAVGRSTVRR